MPAPVWSFLPQVDVIETLEWATDVMRSKGAEQRVSMRRLPRTFFDYRFLWDSKQLQRAKTLARQSDQDFSLPVWSDALPLKAAAVAGVKKINLTASPFLARLSIGSPFLIWESESKYEAGTVTNVSSTSAGGVVVDAYIETAASLANSYSATALVTPLVVARLAQPLGMSRFASSDAVGRAIFASLADLGPSGFSPYAVYQGSPVLEEEAATFSDVNDSDFREVETFDSQTGQLWFGTAYKYPIHRSAMNWDCVDRDAYWRMLRFLMLQKGRWRCFWKSSQGRDFIANATPLSGATALVVQSTGLAELPVPFHIEIRTVAGERLYRKVTGITGPPFGGTQTLTMSSSYGSASGIDSISVLTLMRFDSDRIEIQCGSAGRRSAAVPIMEVP